jgi:hypothetical protein
VGVSAGVHDAFAAGRPNKRRYSTPVAVRHTVLCVACGAACGGKWEVGRSAVSAGRAARSRSSAVVTVVCEYSCVWSLCLCLCLCLCGVVGAELF